MTPTAGDPWALKQTSRGGSRESHQAIWHTALARRILILESGLRRRARPGQAPTGPGSPAVARSVMEAARESRRTKWGRVRLNANQLFYVGLYVVALFTVLMPISKPLPPAPQSVTMTALDSGPCPTGTEGVRLLLDEAPSTAPPSGGQKEVPKGSARRRGQASPTPAPSPKPPGK